MSDDLLRREAPSNCIMLIRHAEKPRAGQHGVDDAGDPDSGTLSVTGWRRAGALVPYFATLAGQVHGRLLGRPRHIFAARPTDRQASTRPRDTVQPLADLLGIPIDERWAASDPVDRIAEALRAFDAPVLVCWRHEELPRLGKALLPDGSVPRAWPEDRYDVTWAFRRDGDRWKLLQVPQLLLAGDRADLLR